MKVTYIHQYFSTTEMSGGVRSYEVARQLVAKGHEVNMITSNRGVSDSSDWYKTVENGINVYWIPVQYSNHSSYFQRIKAFVEFSVKASFKAASLKTDIVFASSTPLSIGIPGLYASFRQSVPMVFEVRDLWPEVPISLGIIKNPILIWGLKKFESLVYAKSEAVIALSPGMKAGIVKSGYAEERVAIIPNFSDIDLFAMSVRKNQNSNGPLIVYTGTFGLVNGLKFLIELARELKVINSNVNILLVGEGREADFIKNLAKEYNVLNNNLFFQDPISKSELPQLLSTASMSCNIVVENVEVWNNSANKFFDGLASGTPVLINSGGWQDDLIQRYNVGISTYGLTLKESAERINELLNNKAWVDKVGNNALNLAKKNFDKINLINSIEKVLARASVKKGNGIYASGLDLE